MKENIKLVLKGFVIGFGKIIPGVSGAMLAITLGVYERGLRAISNLFNEFRDHYKFLLYLGIGIVLAIVLGSKTVKFCLDNYYLPIMLLFMGMITGGTRALFKRISNQKIALTNIFIGITVIIIVLSIPLMGLTNIDVSLNKNMFSFFILFISGFLDAIATVIPGISATALLMIVGYYNIILFSFSDLFNFNNLINNLFILIPFVLGTGIGIIIVSKLMNYLFSHYETSTYYAIIGFSFSSIILLFKQTFSNTYTVSDIIVGIILFVIGYIITKKLDK